MLNGNQQKILEILRQSIKDDHYLSMQDLARKIGVKSPNTILYHLRKLEKRGFIKRDPNGKVVRVSSPDRSSGLAFLPLLGQAQCGQPLESIIDESTIKMIPIPLRLLNRNLENDLYLVQAIGDSMSPKIEEGDYVVFESDRLAKNGDIVVARTQEGFTIKVFKEVINQFILKPINEKYTPLLFAKNQVNKTFSIDGVAVGVFKPQDNLGGF